ncbi:MAG: GNAT family N-acetyltransferase [Nanoarchaeota archaeon]
MLISGIVKDIDSCEKIWKSSIEPIHFFDEWDYRMCFFDKERFNPHFVVLDEDKGAAHSVLPLWSRRRDGYKEFFGGEFMEFNRIIAPDRESASRLLSSLEGDYWLAYMDPSEKHLADLVPCGSRFLLYLSKVGHSLDAYLNSFSGKHRKNLKNDLKRLEQLNPIVARNRLEDLDKMIGLNVSRFGDDSFLAEQWFVDGIKRFVNTANSKGHLEMLSILIDNKPESVQLGMIYNKRYSVILGGNNMNIPNIGKLMVVEHIKNAIRLKADVIDFLCTDSGWKKLWNLEEEAVYEFSNMSDDDYVRLNCQCQELPAGPYADLPRKP